MAWRRSAQPRSFDQPYDRELKSAGFGLQVSRPPLDRIVVEKIKELEYYGHQKQWMIDSMKAKNKKSAVVPYGTLPVMKAGVAKTIAKFTGFIEKEASCISATDPLFEVFGSTRLCGQAAY